MDTLFGGGEDGKARVPAPLAERMRPRSLEEFLGPEELTGPEGLPARFAASDPPPSLILWGPPGSGKTSLARLLAGMSGCAFERMSAVLAGVADVRRIISAARRRRDAGKRTLLFVDEIHRFNKAQQDAFLPHVEDGTIVLVGATTENPSFEVIPALLSRCRVVRLPGLTRERLAEIARRALEDEERGLGGRRLSLEEEALELLCTLSDGDARALLNMLELAASALPDGSVITKDEIRRAVQERTIYHDKSGDAHYNLISAFHKSMRGSDPDAALHYFWRMVLGGDSPLYILRRMFNFAAEDVGNADPQALVMVASALSAYRLMGDPEGLLPVAQAVVYLACAPKSNAVYRAFKAARKDVEEGELPPVPDHLVNAPTRTMRELGFGAEYRYPHDYRYSYVAQEYLPQGLRGRRYYEPEEVGFERELKKRLAFWRNLKKKGHDEPKGK